MFLTILPTSLDKSISFGPLVIHRLRDAEPTEGDGGFGTTFGFINLSKTPKTCWRNCSKPQAIAPCNNCLRGSFEICSKSISCERHLRNKTLGFVTLWSIAKYDWIECVFTDSSKEG